MIERESQIKISWQCEILEVSRSSHYSALSDIFNVNISDEELIKKIDKIYTDYSFYGSRRIQVELLRYHSLKCKQEEDSETYENYGYLRTISRHYDEQAMCEA